MQFITVKESDIRPSENLKLVGVTLDSRLNFSHRVEEVCTKVRRRIGMLMRLKVLVQLWPS